MMRPRRPKQFCLQLNIYIYNIYTHKGEAFVISTRSFTLLRPSNGIRSTPHIKHFLTVKITSFVLYMYLSIQCYICLYYIICLYYLYNVVKSKRRHWLAVTLSFTPCGDRQTDFYSNNKSLSDDRHKA